MSDRSIDVFKLPVHPAADVFPMMDNGELQDLANDIDNNGLRQPLVVAKINGELMLLDGRNRREACRRADVTPEFVTMESVADPEAYILSLNVLRRHLTKAQRAMATAMIYPEPGKGGRAKKGSVKLAARSGEFSDDLVTRARAVLRFSQELALEVLDGRRPLLDALKQVEAAKRDEANRRARLRTLSEERADLAFMVDDGSMDLLVAEAQANIEAKERKKLIMAFSNNLNTAIEILDRGPEQADVSLFDSDVIEQPDARKITRARLRRAALYLEALEKNWVDDPADTESLLTPPTR